jgi:hypothetical protein
MSQESFTDLSEIDPLDLFIVDEIVPRRGIWIERVEKDWEGCPMPVEDYRYVRLRTFVELRNNNQIVEL